MSSNEDNGNEKEDDDQRMNQNKRVKNSNDILDEIIDNPRSFEEQIKSLNKLEDLKGHCPCDNFGNKQ